MDDSARTAHLTVVGRMGALVIAINELIARSQDPSAVRDSIKASVERIAGVFEADDDLDRVFVAMQMRDQLDEFSE